MVDGVLRVQSETSGRLDRLAALQRAMFIVTNDLQQVTLGSVEGSTTRLAFNRHISARGGSSGTIAYQLDGTVIARDAGAETGQRLLDGVASLSWHYHAPSGWIDHWPPDPDHAADWPDAISLDVALIPVPNQPAGTLRRVIALPEEP